MSERDTRLDAVRREIDRLDAELLDLLNRRARAVVEVVAIKQHDPDPRYYRPEREAALLRRLVARNAGPLSDVDLARLFREIVSTCRSIEQRLTIGCATVREACAAIGHFGGAIDIVPFPGAIEAVIDLDAGPCDYAVIEFSRNGAAMPVLADIPARGLALCGEWFGKDGERYVVIGRGSVGPTGDDWTSFIVASSRVREVDSFCSGADLRMRATPVDGRELFVVDIGIHADDPRLSSMLEKWDGVALGTYPNTGADS